MGIETMLWRRLDVPGHDACRLVPGDDAWRLEGTAVFRHEGVPAGLAYRVDCDSEWRTRSGFVRGWVGARAVDLHIERTPAGVWTLNGQIAPAVEGCVDLDFGFTPATNLLQLRRVALPIGDASDIPVAWLDAPGGTLDLLQQRYERRTVGEYWYEAPRFGYSALLAVNAADFVNNYPRLWESES